MCVTLVLQHLKTLRCFFIRGNGGTRELVIAVRRVILGLWGGGSEGRVLDMFLVGGRGTCLECWVRPPARFDGARGLLDGQVWWAAVGAGVGVSPNKGRTRTHSRRHGARAFLGASRAYPHMF